ncbi:MAG: AAA family ATPase [Clostridia bacterium]|nr:AAA family ATPase [Clostridia bacterium]
MFINKIKLENFRNYKKQEIELDRNINIIYGNNAQGKTNILEAIFLCSMGKSFRAKKENEIIKIGEEKAFVEIEYQKEDRLRKN